MGDSETTQDFSSLLMPLSERHWWDMRKHFCVYFCIACSENTNQINVNEYNDWGNTGL